ncbi:MAG: YfhO family protein [Candidatus Hydrogenedentota bacterium]
MTTENTRKPLTWKALVIHGLVLGALLVALFPRVFFAGEVAIPGGLIYELPPWELHKPENYRPTPNKNLIETLIMFPKFYALADRALEAGEWPLWNPLEQMGMPLLANFQSTVFYPPRLLFVFMDIYYATTVFVLLKLWLAGMTAFLCAWVFRLSRPACVFFSIAWMLSGYNVTWTHWTPTDVSAWTPVILMGAEIIVQGKYRRGFFALAFGGAMLMLAGHPQTAFAFGLGVGGYFILRLLMSPKNRRQIWKPVVVALGAWTIAVLLCSAQLLPFAEYVPRAIHVARSEANLQSQFFLPPSVVSAFWAPRFYGHTLDGTYWGSPDINTSYITSLYPGIVVWVGVFLLLTQARHLSPMSPSGQVDSVSRTPKVSGIVQHRKHVIALSLPAFFLALMAFPLPALEPIQKLPLLDAMMRCYYIVFAMFALPLLAAIGFDCWWQNGRKRLPLLLTGALCIAGGSILVALHRLLAPPTSPHTDVIHPMIIAGIFASGTLTILAIACFRRARGPLFIYGLCALAATDLLVTSRDLNATAPRAWLYPETELTRHLQALGTHARFYFKTAGIDPGHMYAYDLEGIYAYEALIPKRTQDFLWEYGELCPWAKREPLCSADYYLFREASYDVEESDPRFEYIGLYDKTYIMRNLEAFPRAFLIGNAESSENVEQLYARMGKDDFDPTTTVLTDAPPGQPLPHSTSADVGNAELIERSYTHASIEISANEPAILVFTDTYYPGWTATIDETPAEIFPAYGAFRAVVVPEGKHTVTFNYFPRSFQMGLALSIIACLASGPIALYLVLKRRGPA